MRDYYGTYPSPLPCQVVSIKGGQMREKIAEIIGKYNPPSDNEAPIAIMYSDEECTDQILTLITDEIKKVENPLVEYNEKIGTHVRSYIRRCYEYYQVGNLPTSIYEDIVKTSGVIQIDIERMLYDNAFEACRQKILDMLKGGE